MEDKKITVMPVSASGLGSWIIVNIDGTEYKSTPTQDEFNYDAMDNAMEEIYTLIDQTDREAVELKYYALKDAMKIAEEEEAYRAEHPEEFMVVNNDTMTDPVIEAVNTNEGQQTSVPSDYDPSLDNVPA